MPMRENPTDLAAKGVLGFIMCILLLATSYSCQNLQFSFSEISMEPGNTAVLDIVLSTPVERNITVSFLYQEDDRILPFQIKPIISNISDITLYPGQMMYEIKIIAKDVGEVLIHMNSSATDELESSNLFVDVRVINSFEEQVLAKLCGWIYLLAWSFMQLPQIYLSWKTKSMKGVSYDFVLFNTIGNVTYMLYNALLFYVDNIKTLYRAMHPFGLIPVELNDVICSWVMTIISLVQVVQCCFYDAGEQRVNKVFLALLGCISLFITVMLILTLVDVFIWLTFLTALSYLKVLSAPAKYIPQVVYNYRRKSTVGWSVYFSWLDLIGGFGSVGQMILNAENQADWSSLWGNMPKFSLGVLHIIFDFILLFQHFVLYRNCDPYETLQSSQASGVSRSCKSLDQASDEKH